VTSGAWHLLRVRLAIGDPNSVVAVSLDGVDITALNQPQAVGTTPIGRVQIGDDTTGKAYTMLYDDVVVDTSSP
jgi:hypothetical protein